MHSDEHGCGCSIDSPGSLRLRPEEWTSGEIVWLIDMVGDSAGLNVALKTLQAGEWKGVEVKVALVDDQGLRQVHQLGASLAQMPGDDSPASIAGSD